MITHSDYQHIAPTLLKLEWKRKEGQSCLRNVCIAALFMIRNLSRKNTKIEYYHSSAAGCRSIIRIAYDLTLLFSHYGCLCSRTIIMGRCSNAAYGSLQISRPMKRFTIPCQTELERKWPPKPGKRDASVVVVLMSNV